jgi:hypothetical protein
LKNAQSFKLIHYIYGMKTILMILLFALIPLFSFSQRLSKIYIENGELEGDHAYYLNNEQLIYFHSFEDTLTKHVLSAIYYPEQGVDANVATKLVVSFELNDSGIIHSVKIENDTVKNDFAHRYFLKAIKHTLDRFKVTPERAPSLFITIKFFVVFKFSLSETEETKIYFSQGMFIINRKRPRRIIMQ